MGKIRSFLLFVKVFLLVTGVLFINVAVVSADTGNLIERNIPVLMYHHIMPAAENVKFKDNGCVLDLEEFEKQIKYLYENEFYSLSPADVKDFLYEYKSLPQKSIWITFDDGYYSNLVYAYPILKKYGLRATVFVITSYVTDEIIPENPNKLIYMNWQEMGEYTDVFDFGSHTNDMHNLNGDDMAFLQTESSVNIINDIKKSFSYPDINVKYALSYPYGKYNEKTIECIKNLGVEIAVTVRTGYMRLKASPYEIPRFNIYRGIPFNKFIKIVNKSI